MTLLTLLRSDAGGPVPVHQEWDSSWLVESSAAAVHQGWMSSWVVRTVYVPQPVALQRTCRWRVLAEPAAVRLSRGIGWRVLQPVGQQWDGGWMVRDVSPVRQQWTGAWQARNLVRLAASPAWAVERRAEDLALHCVFNGIDLNNGTTTHVMGKGTTVGADGVEYDMIRHYDGSRVAHDVRITEAAITVPLAAKFPDAASLGSFIAGLKAACKAGGTLSLQVSPAAPMRTFGILPSSPPVIEEDNRFILQHVAHFALTLTRWAE